MVVACAMATAFPSTRPSATTTTSIWIETLVPHTPATTIPARTINEVKARVATHTEIQILPTGGASGLTTTGGMMALMGLGLLI